MQHDSVSGRSVDTNLCTFLEYASPIVINRGQVDTMHFDMSKAFDRVSHALLLRKLFSCGVCWDLCGGFESYLSPRSNTVRVADSFSELFCSTSGVPQGSMLGALLFLIFINDKVSCVSSLTLLLSADEIELFMSIHTLSDCNILHNYVSLFLQGCKLNKLSLNPSKTKALSFGRRHAGCLFCI